MYFLFTLHENKKDFRIRGAVLAETPEEAASILGGEYIKIENQPPGSSTNPDDLSLFGKIKFGPHLFRNSTNEELAKAKLDYNPGKFYEKKPGLLIWERPGEEGREFVLRRNPIC